MKYSVQEKYEIFKAVLNSFIKFYQTGEYVNNQHVTEFNAVYQHNGYISSVSSRNEFYMSFDTSISDNSMQPLMCGVCDVISMRVKDLDSSFISRFIIKDSTTPDISVHYKGNESSNPENCHIFKCTDDAIFQLQTLYDVDCQYLKDDIEVYKLCSEYWLSVKPDDLYSVQFRIEKASLKFGSSAETIIKGLI